MNYETIFIAKPDSTQEELDELLKGVKGILSDKKTVIVTEQQWGRKRLAYEIDKNKEGLYYYLKFSSGLSEVPGKLAMFYKQNGFVLRFLTLKLDQKKK